MRITLAAVCLHLLATSLFAETLILDENAYLRSYLRFAHEKVSPDLIKAALKENPKAFYRQKKYALKMLEKWGRDVEKLDWTENWFHPRRGIYRDTYALKDNAPPAADWMKPDFDDSTWVRKQRPFATNDQFATHLGSACFRTWFSVKDPKSAELTLKVAFHGGARVFLNGKEIARAHLPEGELGADAAGDVYSKDAYFVTWEETAYSLKPKDRRSRSHYVIGNMPGAFDAGIPIKDAPQFRAWGQIKRGRHKGSPNGTPISQAAWDRLQKTRDRVIGPLKLPAKLLKAGGNLLAIEILGAHFRPDAPGETFAHCHLAGLSLKSNEGNSATGLSRPAGLQVWTEDVHKRIFAREFKEPGAPVGVLSYTGAMGGTYGKQLVIGSDQALKHVSVSVDALSLKGGGESIPASAVRLGFMIPRSLADIGKDMGGARDTAEARDAGSAAVKRYAPANYAKLPKEEKRAFLKSLNYYDQIGPSQTADIPADTCRPVWVSVAVPANATPGHYQGSVRVSAAGLKPVDVPISLKVLDWRVPQARDFTFMAAVDQSPYGIAKHYKCELWSDDHFQKMENSFGHIGRLGPGWLHIPVLTKSEYGNYEDAPIHWIQKEDGSLTFDFSRMDRYLDLAIKHWGKPRVISFNVMHGESSRRKSACVMIKNEKDGKLSKVDLGPSADKEQRHKCWQAFCVALGRHMKTRGLADRMYWGTPWDSIKDPDLMQLLASFLPDVTWSRHSHAGGPVGQVRVASSVYNLHYWYPAKKLLNEGFAGGAWKHDRIHLSNSRRGTQVHLLEGYFPPFSYRVLCERAQGRGMTGVGRMGGDYWGLYLKGVGGFSHPPVGFGVANLLCPGEAGADSSQRLEVLLESIQEMEAKIYLEKALDSGVLDESLTDEIRQCFVRLSAEPNFIPSGHDNAYSNLNRFLLHDLHQGWQRRTTDLYALAARAAQKIGLGLSRSTLTLKVVPKGDNRIEIKLENRNHKPSTWKASVDVPWLKLEKSEGQVRGSSSLRLPLLGSALKPGSTMSGSLTITDGGNGRKHVVPVSVEVPLSCEVLLTDRIFDVEIGQSAIRKTTIVNHSAAPLAWQLKSPAPWITLTPAAGKLGAFEQQAVTITVTPPAGVSRSETALQLFTQSGGAVQEIPLFVYGFASGSNPEDHLKGEKVFLADVHDTRLLLQFPAPKKGIHADILPAKFAEGRNRTFYHRIREELTYNLEESGFDAFAVKLRVHPKALKKHGHTRDRKPPHVSMKIFVDGRLRADSGRIEVTEQEGRLVAVPFIGGARAMRIVTSGNAHRDPVQWLEPVFYKGGSNGE